MCTENFEAKRFNLSVTTYGIHALYHKKLEDIILKEFHTHSIFMYEYLLDSPIVKGCNSKIVQNAQTFAPFLRRILNEMTFTPIYNPDNRTSVEVKFTNQTFDNVKNFWTAEGYFGASATISKTQICKQVIEKWIGNEDNSKFYANRTLNPVNPHCSFFYQIC